jgi:benzoate 4-monooxygenase
MDLLHYILLCLVLIPLWISLYYILPYFTTYAPLRNIPGPFLAKFSNVWLAYHSRKRQKYAAVHAAHARYGTVVRIGYNHISIASEEGIPLVYAHGNGFLKAEFYDAFVSGVPGVFNTRDRVQHTRKRKIVAHAFSPAAVVRFERHMAENLETWVKQLDGIAASPEKDGYKRVNIMAWCTYIAFDIIGALAFGAPFGMVEKGRDECVSQQREGPVVLIRGAETLNRRGDLLRSFCLILFSARDYSQSRIYTGLLRWLCRNAWNLWIERLRRIHLITISWIYSSSLKALMVYPCNTMSWSQKH